MGEANVSTAGGADLEHANNIAREMVYRCGFRCAHVFVMILSVAGP